MSSAALRHICLLSFPSRLFSSHLFSSLSLPLFLSPTLTAMALRLSRVLLMAKMRRGGVELAPQVLAVEKIWVMAAALVPPCNAKP